MEEQPKEKQIERGLALLRRQRYFDVADYFEELHDESTDSPDDSRDFAEWMERKMTELKELRNQILREVYSEAEPGLDFDDLLANPDDYPDNWFEQHTLSAEREREIFEKHTADADLTESERTYLLTECILNLGPSNPSKDDEL
jgi:hypothetical protein